MNRPRVAIYSAIYGDYEATAKRLPPDLDVPAIMFTDQARIVESGIEAGWKVMVTTAPYGQFRANPANGDPAIVAPMLAHKFWKTHPREAFWSIEGEFGVEEPDVSIWLDGSMEINVPGSVFVDLNLLALGDDDWSVMRHPWRSCVFDEAVYSSTLIYRYDGPAMMRQHDAYLEAGHPRGWGLFATGHMVRRHTPLVAEIGVDWWAQNLVYSHQDQLSLPFLFWKYGQSPDRGHDLRWNTSLPWAQMWNLHPHGA